MGYNINKITDDNHNSNSVETEIKQEVSNSTKKQWLIAAVIIPVIATILIPLLIYYLSRPPEEPKFIIDNSILRSDATLVIKANNKKSNQKKKLDIIFDGCSFPKKGIPINSSSDGMQKWHFKLQNHTKVDSLIKDGDHKVKVGFPGDKLSDEFKIIFVNDQPIVGAEIIQKYPSTKILKGKATTKTQIPENEIKVDVTFYHEGSKEKKISVPVKKVEYEDTGLIFFEFETPLKNFPEISPSDSRYSEIFFALKVSDKAGNEYYYEESYGQYVTGGKKRFGVLNANFKIDKEYDDATQSLNSTFLVKPNQPLSQSNNINIVPSISLKVTSRIVNLKRVRRLDWKSNIPQSKPLAFVYRNGKNIGESETNSYTDTDELPKEIAKYHIEMISELGKTYKSNPEIYSKSMDPTAGNKEFITLEAGWNLISLPIIPDNTKISTIFPGIEFAYSYQKKFLKVLSFPISPASSNLKNYNKVVHINPGNAYFVYSKKTNQYILTGKEFSYFAVKLDKGWNLIGCINKTVTPTTSPKNSIDAIFVFNKKFILADKLEKGKGYWIKTKQTCELILGSRNRFKRSNLSEKIVDQNGSPLQKSEKSYTDTDDSHDDLQIQFPTPGDFPLDGEIRATGSHSLPLNNRVWALLGDAYGNFYLQNPPVRLHRNGSWSALLRPGHSIISLYIVLVDENGNNQFKQKVKSKEWGGFTELPFNSRVLNSVE